MDLDNPHGSAKPCKTEGCGHIARDHERSRKINGVWTGSCYVCDCKQYTY